MKILKFEPRGKRSTQGGNKKPKVSINPVNIDSFIEAELVIPNVMNRLREGDLGFDLGDLEFDLRVLIPMVTHLNALIGRVSRDSIQMRRDLIKDQTLAALQELVRNSVPSEWTARPAYFRALVEEIRSRSQKNNPR